MIRSKFLLGLSNLNAKIVTGLEKLHVRRENICLKFIQKNLESERPFLSKIVKNYPTRSSENMVSEIFCRTKKFDASSLPFLARLYNSKLKRS